MNPIYRCYDVLQDHPSFWIQQKKHKMALSNLFYRVTTRMNNPPYLSFPTGDLYNGEQRDPNVTVSAQYLGCSA
jgi:hypothetical protein